MHRLLNLPYIANRYGIVTAIAIASAALCAHLTGLVRVADQGVFDLINTYRLSEPATEDILLVELQPSREALPAHDLMNVCEQVYRLGAARIGITFPIEAEGRALLQTTEAAKSVVFGARLNELFSANEPMRPHDETLVGKLPSQDSTSKLATEKRIGFTDLDYAQVVYRKHRSRFVIDGRLLKSLELSLVEPILLSDVGKVPQEFAIDYIGGANSLPIVDSSTLERGELIPELVRNRIVLIGEKSSPDSHVAIPTTGGTQKLSRLEVHGHILRTLLSRRFVEPLSTEASALLLFLTTLICIQFFRKTSLSTSVLAILFAFLTQTLVCWLSLHSTSLQLPFSAMFLAVVLSAVQCLAFRFRIQSELVESWTLMRQTQQNKSTHQTADTLWDRIGDATYQLFYPQRLALLQLVPGNQHLQIVALRQCEEHDIRERRRDIGRSPFSDASKANQAIANPQSRGFFKNTDQSGSIEFIVPIRHGGQTHGFLVAELSQAALSEWPGFEEFLSEYASGIAEVVDQHYTKFSHSYSDQTWIDRLLVTPEEIRQSRLYESDIASNTQNEWLRRSFEVARVPAAVFDGFGHMVFCNQAMSQVFQQQKLEIDNLNFVSAVLAITNAPIDVCRTLFRRSLRENASQELKAEVAGFDAEARLSIQPIQSQAGLSSHSMRGVCVQIETAHRVIADQSRGSDRLKQQLNELRHSVNKQWQSSVARSDQNQSERYAHLFSVLNQCENALAEQDHEHPHNLICVHPSQICKDILNDNFAELNNKTLCVVDQLELADSAPVRCNLHLLQTTFEVLLECFADHALPESGVFAFDRVSPGQHIIVLESVATGVCKQTPPETYEPDYHRQQCQRESATLTLDADAKSLLSASQLERLAEVGSWLKGWKSRLSVTCTERFQLRFELHFPSESDKVTLSTRKTLEEDSSHRIAGASDVRQTQTEE